MNELDATVDVKISPKSKTELEEKLLNSQIEQRIHQLEARLERVQRFKVTFDLKQLNSFVDLFHFYVYSNLLNNFLEFGTTKTKKLSET